MKALFAILLVLLTFFASAQKQDCNYNDFQTSILSGEDWLFDCADNLMASFEKDSQLDSFLFVQGLSAYLYYQKNNFKKADSIAKLVVKNSENLNTNLAILARAKSSDIVARSCFYLGNLDTTERYFNISLSSYKELNDTVGWTGILNGQSVVAAERSNHQLELELLIEILRVEEKLKDQAAIASSLVNLAQCYMSLNDPSNARKYAMRGIEISKSINNQLSLSYAYNALADTYLNEHNPHKALPFYRKAALMGEEIKDQYILGGVYKNLGDVHLELKTYDSSAYFYKKAYALQLAMGDYNHGNRTKINYARTLVYLNKSDDALQLLDSIETDIKSLELPSLSEIYYRTLHEVYLAKDDYKNAFLSFRQATHFQDSIQSNLLKEDLNKLKTEYQVEFTEKENEILKEKNQLQEISIERKNLLVIISLSALVLITIIALLLFRAQKIIKKQTSHLAESLKENEKLLEIKNQIFAIIAHDLRGPMGSLKQLLEFLDEEQDNSSELISMARRTSQSSFQLLETLLIWANQSRGKLNYHEEVIDLTAAIQESIDILNTTAKNKNIALSLKIQDSLRVKGDENMLKTTIRNIVSNALKFTPAQGTVSIIAARENGIVKVSVHDTGIGMDHNEINQILDPNGFYSKPGTNNEKGTGLGLKISQNFLSECGGNLQIDSIKAKGTTVSFTLPNAEK